MHPYELQIKSHGNIKFGVWVSVHQTFRQKFVLSKLRHQ